MGIFLAVGCAVVIYEQKPASAQGRERLDQFGAIKKFNQATEQTDELLDAAYKFLDKKKCISKSVFDIYLSRAKHLETELIEVKYEPELPRNYGDSPHATPPETSQTIDGKVADLERFIKLLPTKLCPPEPAKAAVPAPEPVKLYNVGTLRKRPTEPLPPTEFPFGPNGPYETASFEFSGYGGSVAASSFGSDFNPNIWGGRAVARVPVGQFRLQADIQGERTNDYSSNIGNRSYFAGGAHADWMVATNTEIGAFGGFQDAKPMFFGPTSTNYFIGLEGRKFFGPAMVGVQFGRFDVTNGPGTLTDAWFVEGRAKFSLGEAFRTPALKYTILGGNLGYGSGTASAVSMGAQTTYWGLGLTQGIANTPVRLSLTYDHFENHVDGLGLVWKENKLMGGVKVLFPSTDVTRGRIEPTVPLPYILGTVMTF
jgi:hypothetical protein